MKRLFSCAVVLPLAVLACSSTTTTTPNPGSSSGGADDAGADGAPPASSCSAQRDNVLLPIDRVANATVAPTTNDATVLYVDASAGGANMASRNPRVYVHLGEMRRVDVTDVQAFESTEWDLALKRTVIYTNGGDGGPGQGGTAILQKDFDQVTAADADAAEIVKESFFDEECNEKKDQFDLYLGTTFSDWYDYSPQNNVPTPKPGRTYIVVGGGGQRYKLAITSFTGRPDGATDAPSTGFYLLKVAPL